MGLWGSELHLPDFPLPSWVLPLAFVNKRSNDDHSHQRLYNQRD